MQIPIILPELGAPHVELCLWLARPGDAVHEGERLVEVLLGGATFDVASPANGLLAEQRAWPGDVLHTGQVLGVVATADESVAE